jgi:hypothetical protein
MVTGECPLRRYQEFLVCQEFLYLLFFYALSSATLRPARAVPRGQEFPRRAHVRGGKRERGRVSVRV